MREHDEVWELVREGAPLPEAPAWFAARTLARLRTERAIPRRWMVIPSWVWAGSCGLMAIALFLTWEIHEKNLRDQQVTFAALDILSNGDKPHYQEEAWFTSY